MAIGRGGKLALIKPDDSGYLSDESDFYGDEAAIQELEYRAGRFGATEWWEGKTSSLTEIANSNMSTAVETASATLYNPYEGSTCGRQLGETVDEFLTRLPPATTRVSVTSPWIFIANPFRKAPSKEREHNAQEQLLDEAPPEEDSDLTKFMVLAGNLLEELSVIQQGIEMSMAGRVKSQITKAVNVEKDKIVRKILDTATEMHVTSGKWMMFCPSNEVNTVWSVVARHTAEGDLGIAAKVAPDANDGNARLICVYTENFNDMEDVTRVIRKMKDLGLVSSRERPIYYKCDAYTYLGLNSNNEYEIKASLYSSKDVLDGKKQQKKLDGFFKKKWEDNNDWRHLEQ